jgi:1-acyl-sn-glycerol-3-phosphate acyltransferase
MRRLFQYIYFAWMALWFSVGFLMIFPFIYIIIQKPKWHKYYFPLSKAWAWTWYLLMLLPVKSIWRFKPQKHQSYVYCPNHFSFLDIPLLTLSLPSFYVFVGLHNLEKIPLFGYFYKKIHITVNRNSFRNRYEVFQRCKDAVGEGKNLVIFPEGGIWTTEFPKLSAFKDGPFRIAIEQQVPVVPVTIPYNWIIMPLIDFKQLRWHTSHIIFHEPISTEGLSLKDVDTLKQKTYLVIKEELEKYFGSEE